MGETKNFVFYKDWREFIKGLSDPDDQFQLLMMIMEYGVTGEYETENASPLVLNTFEAMIKPAIERSQKNYQASKDYGKTHGRPKMAIDERIDQMCKQGMRAKDIATALGCSETSVYHSDAWKNRKK